MRGLLVVSDPGNKRIQVLSGHGAPLQVLNLERRDARLLRSVGLGGPSLSTSLDGLRAAAPTAGRRQRVFIAGRCGQHCVHVLLSVF